MNPRNINDESIYFTDNGALYCGQHLGASARFSGRDISGQEIAKVQPAEALEMDLLGFPPECEQHNCRRRASALEFSDRL